jgi:hypothetical protein
MRQAILRSAKISSCFVYGSIKATLSKLVKQIHSAKSGTIISKCISTYTMNQ